MQLVLVMVDVFAEASWRGVEAVWRRWIGRQRFARKLAQLVRKGWVEALPEGANMERVIRLTPAGRLAGLGGRDPERCWRRQWDGRWRVVLFDVPEAQRTQRLRLRRYLRALGFGYLQNSVWLTPDPLDTFDSALRGAAIDVETLSFMEARPCGGESDTDLVAGAWDFERINQNYDAYLEILAQKPRRGTAEKWLAHEWAAWCRALHSDPLLPEALLPRSYRGRKAWEHRRAKLPGMLKGL